MGFMRMFSSRRFALRTLPLWAIGLLLVVAGWGCPLVLGLGIGSLLAVANFSLSIYLSSKALSASLLKSEIIVLFGFLLRLTALGALFTMLSGAPHIHVMAALTAFAAGVTLLLIWEIRIYMHTSFPLISGE